MTQTKIEPVRVRYVLVYLCIHHTSRPKVCGNTYVIAECFCNVTISAPVGRFSVSVPWLQGFAAIQPQKLI